MKIKDSTLRQIIREEYSRLINEDGDDAPKTVKQKLKDAITAEHKSGTALQASFLESIQSLHNKGTLNDQKAAAEAKKLNRLSAAAKAALRG
jgi:hypothetical protein